MLSTIVHLERGRDGAHAHRADSADRARGIMVPMTTNPLLEWPMYLMPARWGFQA